MLGTRQGWLRPHGRLVHPRCKCAPCRFLDPRTGTRTTQVPATKSCLTSPGNRASAARTGLPAALHARYFQKSPIWAPKSPPARRLPPNVADQVHLTLNPSVRSGSNLTAEAGSNSKKIFFGRHYIGKAVTMATSGHARLLAKNPGYTDTHCRAQPLAAQRRVAPAAVPAGGPTRSAPSLRPATRPGDARPSCGRAVAGRGTSPPPPHKR